MKKRIIIKWKKEKYNVISGEIDVLSNDVNWVHLNSVNNRLSQWFKIERENVTWKLREWENIQFYLPLNKDKIPEIEQALSGEYCIVLETLFTVTM